MTPENPALAVVVKGWPRLSETFIAQELAALEQRGIQFDIWSLRFPTDKKRHPLHNQITARIRYLPEYLHQEPLRVFRAWLAVRKLPGYAKARQIWATDYRRDRTRNRLRRFGQACVLAHEMPVESLGLYAHFMHTPSSVARYAAMMRGLPWGVFRPRQRHLDIARMGIARKARCGYRWGHIWRHLYGFRGRIFKIARGPSR
jgi:colanic acid/amylovoran biosynthesis glycosyltransferase